MARLLVLSSSPMTELGGRIYMNRKFCEGMRYNCEAWDGEVISLNPCVDTRFPFDEETDISALPFQSRRFPAGQRIQPEQIADADVILCSGDNYQYLHLPDIAGDVPVVFIIEYTLETRLQIHDLAQKSFLADIKGRVWNHWHERRRKRAFRNAAGLQANGYPAHASYAGLNAHSLLYLDNRVRLSMMADDNDMQARAKHDGPLRIIHSGRLERLKGSHDVITVAEHLAKLGCAFQLDIFGEGDLEPEMKSRVQGLGLDQNVTFHGSVDFETKLVPFTRQHSDLFLSCHLQSDPSCTYLEAMGCGVPIAGYANRMWRALHGSSGAGLIAPMSDAKALAQTIHETNRADLLKLGQTALDFARQHSFEQEFARRIAHLKAAT